MSIRSRLDRLEASATPAAEPEARLTDEELRKLPPAELLRRHRRALGLDGTAAAVGPRPDPAEEERLRRLSDEELHRLHREALANGNP